MDDIIKAIYNEDEKLFLLNKDVFHIINKGWGVIHYLVDAGWYHGIDLFIKFNGNIHQHTEDYIFHNKMNNLYIIGGRNALFNVNNDEKMEHYLLELGLLDIEDNNGNHYKNIKMIDNNVLLYKENYLKVAGRINNIFRNKLIFSMPVELHLLKTFDDRLQIYKLDENYHNILHQFNDVNYSVNNINSMHYESYLVNIDNVFIRGIINNLMNLENTKLLNITNITAFMIQYDTTYQKELKIHKDDSVYTINICIIEPEEGANLVMTDLNVSIEQKQYEIYFHKGCETHLVEPLIKGIKKNIIIWIK